MGAIIPIAVLFLVVLVDHNYAATLLGQSALASVLRSSKFASCKADALPQLLRHFSTLINSPLRTALRDPPGLLYGADRFFQEQLEAHPHLNGSNLEAWMKHAIAFVNNHANGTWSVAAMTNTTRSVEVRLTALNGLPLVRRVLLAQLLTAWLTILQREVPSGLEPLLAELVTQLYYVHRDSVVQRGVVQYLHISKSGGTAFNDAARANGCVLPSTMGKHVPGFGDECRWLDPSFYRELSGGHLILWARWGRYPRPAAYHTCRQRLAGVASRGYSYFSNEYTLLQGMGGMLGAQPCPEEFVNVVTLRPPLQRMASALRFIQGFIKGYWLRDQPDHAEAAFVGFFCNASAAFWASLAPPISDNYIVRSFLGERGFHTPVGGISSKHVAAARDQLLQFDLVLDLAAGQEAGDRLVFQGLGWPGAWSRASTTLNGSFLASQYFKVDCYPSDEGLDALTRRQVYDMQFYSFGRVVSQLDGLWLDMARALGLKPRVRPEALRPRATPEDIRCGMLWRGSNGSELARALRGAAGPAVDSSR